MNRYSNLTFTVPRRTFFAFFHFTCFFVITDYCSYTPERQGYVHHYLAIDALISEGQALKQTLLETEGQLIMTRSLH